MNFLEINDPAAALDFCQKLSRFLADQQNPAPKSTERPEISVVIPVYNEECLLPLLCERLHRELRQITENFEVIFVDDGSNDRSTELIESFATQHSWVKGIILSRNFGHQAALVAGLDHAQGSAVIAMDADLQDEPEVIPELYKRWKEGFDVVYVVRLSRRESLALRLCYSIFYKVLALVAKPNIPLDAGDFGLIDRKVLGAMRSLRESRPFLRGLRSWVGFKQTAISVHRPERKGGYSKYQIRHLVRLAMDGLVGFSLVPLRCIALTGAAFSLAAVALAAFYIIKKVSLGLSPPGFATITVLVLLLSGVQLFTLGILAEYLGRVLEEVRNRPRYVVNKQLNC